MDITPVTLEAQHARLEPLNAKHAAGLVAVAQSPEIWEFLVSPPVKTMEEMNAWIARANNQTAAGTNVWFAIVRREDGQPVGVTSYLNISRADETLEIGGTWLTPSVWRSAINTECKYLLLRHAFEQMGCRRVQIKTDERNSRSQRAIERLGAVREGVLRQYQKTYTGYQRNTVMYSLIDSEWPQAKRRLETLMASHPQ